MLSLDDQMTSVFCDIPCDEILTGEAESFQRREKIFAQQKMIFVGKTQGSGKEGESQCVFHLE
jgi:hypothetical protein